MKNHFKKTAALASFVLCAFIPTIRAELISLSLSPDSSQWSTGASWGMSSLTLNKNPNGMFDKTTWDDVIEMGSGKAGITDLLGSLGLVSSSAGLEFSSGGFLHQGTEVGDLSSFSGGYQSYFFYYGASWNNKDGALQGDNNFVGFRLIDSLGAWHYGYLQFDLQPFVDGSPGITFVGGYVNSVAGEAIDLVAIIPEPSTYAAIFGLAVLGVALVRRRKAKV